MWSICTKLLVAGLRPSGDRSWVKSTGKGLIKCDGQPSVGHSAGSRTPPQPASHAPVAETTRARGTRELAELSASSSTLSTTRDCKSGDRKAYSGWIVLVVLRKRKLHRYNYNIASRIMQRREVHSDVIRKRGNRHVTNAKVFVKIPYGKGTGGHIQLSRPAVNIVRHQ